jgi:hypothetical protein
LKVTGRGLLEVTYLPVCEDGTEYSEMLAFKIQTPVNDPEESTRHSELGESLKSRHTNVCPEGLRKNMESILKWQTFKLGINKTICTQSAG